MAKSKTSSKATSKVSYKNEPTLQVTPEFEGTDPDAVIFPEWSDQELNAEKWELPKSPPKVTKEPTRPKSESQESGSPSPPQTPTVFQPPPFRDPHSFTLPKCLPVYKWKKPEVLFPGRTLVIFNESSLTQYANLIPGNGHLFYSQFMRIFISVINSLEYLGYTTEWPMEGVTPCYTPNTLGEPWKPWHHVYSACKAGKGAKHRPVVNKMGKYILRLFWLGAWRRIVVDDFIPVDKDDMILLPTTNEVAHANGGNNPNEAIELWPCLLAKGLLKIANLTWTERRELFEFSILHTFTGWRTQAINTINLDPNEIWEMCASYSEHYKWPDERESREKGKKEEKGDKGKKDKTSKSKEKLTNLPKSGPLPYCVFGLVGDLRRLESAGIHDIAPCYSHSFLIDQVRNIPLVKPEYKPSLEPWKRFRWIEWARRQGLYSEEDSSLKYLKLVDFFKKVSSPDSSFINQNPSSRVQVPTMSIVTDPPQEGKSDRTARDSKNIVKGFVTPPNPSFWIDFNEMGKYIEFLYIYFRPALFQTHLTITDLADKKSTKTTSVKAPKKKDASERIEKKILWPYRLIVHRNEPLYMFFDGLNQKTLIITLSHAGNRQILQQKCLTVHCDLTSLWQKKINFVARSRMRRVTHILVENYDWSKNTFGDFNFGLNTVGARSVIRIIEPGRHLLRFWIKSSTSYNVTILADGDLEIGTWEYILECMPSESERYLEFCYQFGTSFGNLVQSFGLSHFKEELHNFRNSFLPPGKKQKKMRQIFEEELFKDLARIIQEKIPECGEVMFALRVLFLKSNYGFQCPPRKMVKDKKPKKVQPKIKEQPNVVIQWDDMECLSDESVSEAAGDYITLEKQKQRAACLIQAFFKMVYIKKLHAYHDPSHPQHLKVFDSLKKLYKEVFNVDNRITNFAFMFRKFFYKIDSLRDFVNEFTFFEDLNHVIHSQLKTGERLCKPASWTNIAKCIFFINSPRDEIVNVQIFCDLEYFFLRIFNNDTGVEMQRWINSVQVQRYSCNQKGYTVLAYGWSFAEQENFKYKINFITFKRNAQSVLIINDIDYKVQRLADIYHHNVNHLIGKCVLVITQDTCVALRFITSYEYVHILLRCVDSDGKVVQEITGWKNIVMPVLFLNSDKSQFMNSMTSTSLISSKKSYGSSKASLHSKTKRRMPNDRTSNTGSLTSRGSRRSKTPIKRLRETSIQEGTTYTVEAYVLNDSWPLTRAEWIESNMITKKSLFGYNFSNMKDVAASRSVMRKLKELSKLRELQEFTTLPNPKWGLEVLHDVADSVIVKFSNTRENEIRALKLKWYEQPGRYEKSKESRNKFIEDVSQVNESEAVITSLFYGNTLDSLTSSVSEMLPQFDKIQVEEKENESIHVSDIPSMTVAEARSNTRPPTASRLNLPPLDYNIYAYPFRSQARSSRSRMFSVRGEFSYSDLASSTSSEAAYSRGTDSLSEGILKKPSDYERDMFEMQQDLDEFDEYYQNYLNEMTEYRNKTLADYHKLQNWFNGIRAESERIMEDAYSLRAKFIQTQKEKMAEEKSMNKGTPKSDEKRKKRGSKKS